MKNLSIKIFARYDMERGIRLHWADGVLIEPITYRVSIAKDWTRSKHSDLYFSKEALICFWFKLLSNWGLFIYVSIQDSLNFLLEFWTSVLASLLNGNLYLLVFSHWFWLIRLAISQVILNYAGECVHVNVFHITFGDFDGAFFYNNDNAARLTFLNYDRAWLCTFFYF